MIPVKKRFPLINNQQGFSLIEILFLTSILVALLVGFTEMTVNQRKETSQLSNKVSLDQRQNLSVAVMGSSNYCNCIFYGKTFNSTSLSWNSVPTVLYAGYSTSCVGTGNKLFEVGSSVDGTTSLLDQISIQSVSEVGVGSGNYTAEMVLKFSNSSQQLAPKPLVVPLEFSVNMSSPVASRTLTSCRSPGFGSGGGGGGSGSSEVWQQIGGTDIYYSGGHIGIGTGPIDPGYLVSLAGTGSPESTTIGMNGMPVVYLPDQAAYPKTLALGNGLRTMTAGAGYNTAVGINALLSNTTGQHNTAIGSSSMKSNTTGSYNLAFGATSLRDNVTGDSNVAVGSQSLQSNISGSDNVATGFQSLMSNQSGGQNTIVGAYAGSNLRAGLNTAVGAYALRGAAAGATGTLNTAVGHTSMSNIQTGSENTALGKSTMGAVTTGSRNVTIGNESLCGVSGGDNNITIGFRSGEQVSGSGNVIIGLHNGSSVLSSNNNVIIAANSYSTTTYKMWFDGSGTVAANLNPSSDQRLKREISSLENPLQKVLALQGVSYRWKDSSKGNQKEIGFIAQEVETQLPELVMTGLGGTKSVAYPNMVSVVVAALQEFYQELKGLWVQDEIQQNRVERLQQEAARYDLEIMQLKLQNHRIKAYLCEQNPQASICLDSRGISSVSYSKGDR